MIHRRFDDSSTDAKYTKDTINCSKNDQLNSIAETEIIQQHENVILFRILRSKKEKPRMHRHLIEILILFHRR